MSAKPKLTTTVSTKGKVILPKLIREQWHWPAGTELEDTPEGVLLKAKPAFAPTRPKDVFGSLPYKGSAKSIADMHLAKAKGCEAFVSFDQDFAKAANALGGIKVRTP